MTQNVTSPEQLRRWKEESLSGFQSGQAQRKTARIQAKAHRAV